MAVDEQQVVRIYANRAKTLLAAGFCCMFAAAGWLFYFVWPTPDVATNPWLYQEPFKTAFFLIWLLFSVAGSFGGLYWTVTPIPLLQLDSMGMVYQQFPFMKRSVYWADVSSISAHKESTGRVDALILWFHIKHHAVLAYGSRSEIEWRIGKLALPLPLDEVVRLMERYHKVTDLDRVIHEFKQASAYTSTSHGIVDEYWSRHVDEGLAEMLRARRRQTRIVMALLIGWLLCSAAVIAFLASVFDLQGAALDLASLLFSLILGWVFFSLLKRYALRGPGRRH